MVTPTKLHKAFTKWYIKRGYTFGYDFTGVPVYTDGILTTPCGVPKSMFNCPWWVKPLLIFFSPSTYCSETWGKSFIEGFKQGLEMSKNDPKIEEILQDLGENS